MKYTGPIYRPPYEAASLLVQVTQGCSYNQCRFCTMYHDVPFMTETMEQIEHDLWEARQRYHEVRRIFLLNGDAFSLGFERLQAIGEKIIEIFPEVETIAAYASIPAIARKSDEELQALRALRFNGMNVGVESGSDEVLALLGKGYTAAEAKAQLLRLNRFGYDYCVNIIVGAGGHGLSDVHSKASAELLNEVQPWMIFLATLFIAPDSQLYKDVKAGTFIENTVRDNLEEEYRLISGLALQDTFLLGAHTSNVVPLQGRLPASQAQLLGMLREAIDGLPKEFLEDRPRRGAEGRYIDTDGGYMDVE